MKLLITIAFVALIGAAAAAPSLSSKVSPALAKALRSKSRVNIFVSFADTKATLASVTSQTFANSGDKATAVYNALNDLAASSQKEVLAMLQSPKFFSTKVQSFWISNQVYVQSADQSLVDALAANKDVVSIDEEIIVYLDDPVVPDEQNTINAEWGIEKINADDAWLAGATGAGAVVGIIDTGARHTHEALRDNFRAGTHSWYDPYLFSQNPRDGQGHGTHVTGTIAGSLGIGVAPQSLWMSCKGLNDQGAGTQAALVGCGQFMACPHGYLGGNPNCALHPHVVSNSWGGSGGQTFYDSVISAWHAVDIIPVFAAANSGPTCSTIGSPSDSTVSTICVAATTSTDAIASFSSRGPSAHAGHHKPDISAPGNQIRSAGIENDNAYATFSGTSMATPHVAGVVALLKGRNILATYETIRNTLHSSAETALTHGAEACGGIPEREFPNHTFGYGRVDALAAIRTLEKSMAK